MSEIEELKRLIIVSGKNVLNTEEAAIMLNISKSRMSHLTNERAFPYYKCGGKNFFKKEDLERYLTKVRIDSQEEIDAEAYRYINKQKKA